MSEELENVRQHILDEIMEEVHIDRMFERMRREPDRIVIFTNGKRYVITVEEEALLAARNQAAEAMGVLEEMLRDEQGDMRQLDIYYHPNAGYSVILTHANREELADGYSDDLIEAVLKAGGEG